MGCDVCYSNHAEADGGDMDARLAFQLAHAQARDAVHLPFDLLGVDAELQALGLASLLLRSAALDRATNLQRPDLDGGAGQRHRAGACRAGDNGVTRQFSVARTRLNRVKKLN